MQTKLFGCKVNNYYLNQRLNHFNEQGLSKENTIIIASCEVTDRAKKKYIKEIIHNIEKGNEIYLTGCGSIEQGKKVSEQKFYNRYPELEKHQNKITLLSESPIHFNEEISWDRDLGLKDNINTRKPIIIQTGCDNHCSFCLTVRKRGKHQSRPSSKIIQEIKEFESVGGKEIVITGINLAARGCINSRNPEENKFAELLEEIIEKTDIPRIRISSLGPEYLTDKFFDIIQNPRFIPHFHFSIQSFSDNVLQNMKRNYSSQKLDEVLTKIKKIYNDTNSSSHPFSNGNISIGADIITGFPGETEEDFMITYNSLEKYGITKLHAFPFSAHTKGETVPASLLQDQISQEIKKQRNRKLIKKGDEIREKFIKTQKGKEFQVLLEQEKNGLRHGWTPNYIEVQVQGNYKSNQIINHKI